MCPKNQLLCYEPCTCRYTQAASASNIPSPCMSARPDEARHSQLLCYERCTCRYTQAASASSIPSPCMSGRPDEARDSQLLCYERCTCRYTQAASASSIPSPCMSGRPDEPFWLPRVSELLCYARRLPRACRPRSSLGPVALFHLAISPYRPTSLVPSSSRRRSISSLGANQPRRPIRPC